MPTISDFKNRFPEFNTIDDTRIQLFLDDSDLMVSTKWGKLRKLGILYLTAHNLAVSQITDTGVTSSPKNIASKSVEGVSVTYESGSPMDSKYNYFNTTSYGKRYIELKMQISVGGARLV